MTCEDQNVCNDNWWDDANNFTGTKVRDKLSEKYLKLDQKICFL